MRRDYGRLVASSAGAALLAVTAKVSAVITIANLQGAALQPRRAFGWLPYLEVVADRATFTHIVTLSTAVMAAVAALRLVPAAARGGADPDVVAGRLLGLVITAETLCLEVVRHLLNGPVLAWPAAAATLAAIAAGFAAWAVAAVRSGDTASRGSERAAPVPPVPIAAPASAAPSAPAPPRRRGAVPTALLALPPDPFRWDRSEPVAGIDEEEPEFDPAR